MKFYRMPPPAKPGEVNYGFFDRFIFAHFLIGCFYFVLGFSFLTTAVLAILWEIVENPLKVHATFIFPHATADSWRNIVSDICAVLSGWTLLFLI